MTIDTIYIIQTIACETMLWGQLSHLNVSPFYGVCELTSPSQMALVSPWYENGNVEVFLKRYPNANRVLLVRHLIFMERSLNASQCADIAAGLEYLHAHNIIHGNLKGVRIMIWPFEFLF